MKKAVLKILYIFAAAVVLCNLICCMRDNFILDMEELPSGTPTEIFVSPSGNRVLTVYLVKNSFGTAVRAALTENGKTDGRNVYWQVSTDRSEVHWLDEGNVSVNDVVINVGMGGSYDCRRGLSIIQEGSMEGGFDPLAKTPD